jgi:RNA polymerase sigma-70 factor (ECF subfamily)
MEDKALIQKLKEGDLSAVRMLVDNNKNLIWHIIVSMTGRNSDNEDLFQEVFLRTFKGINNFRADAKLSTWIGSITHHVCVDYLRHKKRKAEVQNSETDLKEVLNRAAEKESNNEDVTLLLMRAVEKLPPDYRTVITLYHMDEYPYKEIAQITGMPEGTVKSYISRARQMLRQILSTAVPDMAEILNDI